MEDMKKQVESLQVRTPFEKTVKKVLVSLVSKNTAPTLEEPIEDNYKKDLVEFAEFHGIEVPEPQHKDDYVDAIKKHFDL